MDREKEISFRLEKSQKINYGSGKAHPLYICGEERTEYRDYLLARKKGIILLKRYSRLLICISN